MRTDSAEDCQPRGFDGVRSAEPEPSEPLRSWRSGWTRVLFLLALTLGCKEDAVELPRPAAVVPLVPAKLPAPEGPLNVLLVAIDGLRADMPWSGYPRPIAPWLTEFEKRAVSYTRAYAISSTTARSVGPMLAGRYPSEMVRDGMYFTRYMPDNEMLAERLQRAGHLAVGASAHAYFLPGTGIDQGFDEFRVLSDTRLNESRVTSRRLTEAAKEILEARTARLGPKQRFFAYIHYMDPHAPYERHPDEPDFGSAPRDLYDQEVHHTDKWVGALLDWALAEPWGKNLAIIVTADHGESFGEHGHFKHGYHLWEELIRVPLLVYAPGAEPRRIDELTSTIHVARTVLDFMEVDADSRVRGTSLVHEIFGERPRPRTALVDLPRDNLQDRKRALLKGNLKLIGVGDDVEWKMFDLEKDPLELTEIQRTDPRFEGLRQEYTRASERVGLEPVVGDDVWLFGAPPGRRY